MQELEQSRRIGGKILFGGKNLSRDSPLERHPQIDRRSEESAFRIVEEDRSGDHSHSTEAVRLPILQDRY